VIAGRELFIDSIEIPDETDDGKDECPMLNVQ